MPLYQYIKKYPRPRKKVSKAVPMLLILSGLIILSWVTWPILSFKVISSPLFMAVVSPLAESKNISVQQLPQMLVAAAANMQNTPASTNYNNPNNWFSGKVQKKVVTPVNMYTLSIPKLKINNATVIISGDDLNKSLIHYGGTALPGEYGTTVIFGHSTLPALYDPTNYHTIFSILPTLKKATGDGKSDEIYVTYDGITYRYEIIDMVVTKPEDLSSLEQRYDNSYLTLVTCVPPGTYWERLNVKARLIPY